MKRYEGKKGGASPAPGFGGSPLFFRGPKDVGCCVGVVCSFDIKRWRTNGVGRATSRRARSDGSRVGVDTKRLGQAVDNGGGGGLALSGGRRLLRGFSRGMVCLRSQGSVGRERIATKLTRQGRRSGRMTLFRLV